MNRKTSNLALFAAILVALGVVFATVPASAGPSAGTGVVNINTASVEQLRLLPGIGVAKAKAIIDYRTQHPFASPDDLRKVKGIGPKLLERIRSRVVVEGDTTAKGQAKKNRRSQSK